jgi:hypothetical protein
MTDAHAISRAAASSTVSSKAGIRRNKIAKEF